MLVSVNTAIMKSPPFLLGFWVYSSNSSSESLTKNRTNFVAAAFAKFCDPIMLNILNYCLHTMQKLQQLQSKIAHRTKKSSAECPLRDFVYHHRNRSCKPLVKCCHAPIFPRFFCSHHFTRTFITLVLHELWFYYILCFASFAFVIFIASDVALSLCTKRIHIRSMVKMCKVHITSQASTLWAPSTNMLHRNNEKISFLSLPLSLFHFIRDNEIDSTCRIGYCKFWQFFSVGSTIRIHAILNCISFHFIGS